MAPISFPERAPRRGNEASKRPHMSKSVHVKHNCIDWLADRLKHHCMSCLLQYCLLRSNCTCAHSHLVVCFRSVRRMFIGKLANSSYEGRCRASWLEINCIITSCQPRRSPTTGRGKNTNLCQYAWLFQFNIICTTSSWPLLDLVSQSCKLLRAFSLLADC